jgi:hypothetical protein
MPRNRAVGVAYDDPSFSELTVTGTTSLGSASTTSIGFYGTTPVVQRASSVQAASVVSANSWISVTSNAAAFAAEVAATLTGMGLWKGSA